MPFSRSQLEGPGDLIASYGSGQKKNRSIRASGLHAKGVNNAEWYMHEGEVFEPRAPRSNIACMHRPLEKGSICRPSL